MDKKEKYEGFTLSLALVDALPVLFFGGSSIVLGIIFKSLLFIIGACLIFLGGFLKVMWKVVLALKQKDIVFLNKQMKYTMLTGFLLVIISVIINIKRISLSAIGAALVSMPACIFFALFVVGMVAMGVCAKKLDSSVAKNNWIEQCVNGVAQLCLLTALIITAV